MPAWLSNSRCLCFVADNQYPSSVRLWLSREEAEKLVADLTLLLPQMRDAEPAPPFPATAGTPKANET